MSETTEFKSIEEIAREQDGDLLKLVFRTDGTLSLAGADILKFGEAVRRSDRQHWLDKSLREVESESVDALETGEESDIAHNQGIRDAMAAILRAFTAQEKKDG